MRAMDNVLESGPSDVEEEEEESEEEELDEEDVLAALGKTPEELEEDKRKKEEKKKKREEEKEKRAAEREKANAIKIQEIESLKSRVTTCSDLYHLQDLADEFNFLFGDEVAKRKKYKQVKRRDFIRIATENQIPEFAFSFAPTAKEFASRLIVSSGYVPPTPPLSPFEAATPYISEEFPTAESVVDAAVEYLARIYSTNASIRESVDLTLAYYSTISTYPTPTGARTIDAFHEYGPVKALRNKPIEAFNFKDPKVANQFPKYLVHPTI